MQDIACTSAAALADHVRRRALSPVEIVEACIARIEARNPSLGASVRLRRRHALRVRRADRARRGAVSPDSARRFSAGPRASDRFRVMIDRERPADEISLRFVAALSREKLELILGLDSFGEHRQLQPIGAKRLCSSPLLPVDGGHRLESV